MAIYFRARDRREVSASEALDARGVLRHGYGTRVPAYLQDSRFRDVDSRRVGGSEGNRPGYRVFDSDVGRAAKAAAYAEAEAFNRDAWRNPPPPDAGFGSAAVGDAGRNKSDPPLTGRTRCPECEGKGVVHGKYCQFCGGDGWVDDDDDENNDEDNNGSNKRRMPQGELEQMTTATGDRRTVTDVGAMNSAHQKNMARLYDQHAADLSQQWRRDK